MKTNQCGWEKPLMIFRMSRPGLDCTQCQTKYYLEQKQKQNKTQEKTTKLTTKPKFKILF